MGVVQPPEQVDQRAALGGAERLQKTLLNACHRLVEPREPATAVRGEADQIAPAVVGIGGAPHEPDRLQECLAAALFGRPRAARYAGYPVCAAARARRYSSTTISLSSSTDVPAVGLSNVISPSWMRFTRSQDSSTWT
jgi:hypothetical protein